MMAGDGLPRLIGLRCGGFQVRWVAVGRLHF